MIADYIRKSMLESFEFCPQQFYKTWVLKIEKSANQKMLIGTRFHEWAEKFFDYALTTHPDDWVQFIPVEFNDEEVEMITWFINYQRQRYTTLLMENRLDEFTPIYRELFLKCDTLQLKSTLDGAEWISKRDDTVALIEYKTGSKLDESTAYRQLAFYGVLWIMSGNPGRVTELKLINPRLQKVVSTPFTDALQRTALTRVAKLRDAINKNHFPYQCTDGKFAACKLCRPEEIPRLFPDDGMERFSDIYD